MVSSVRMAGARGMRSVTRLARAVRWIHAAPLLAAITLGTWAFASPVGASPDDDYHLASVWCALDGSEACQPGSEETTRIVSDAFAQTRCYAQQPSTSAACLDDEGLALDGSMTETKRGNFDRRYPEVYYAAMHVFAGDDLVKGAVTMRLVNVALFVGLATALASLLSASRRQTLLWGWLVSLVPLGFFLIPSNNPSGWAITGVGTAFLALLGWFESEGKRRWALGALYLVGAVMAAGARSDAAVYVVGATVVASLLTARRSRPWVSTSVLALAGVVVAVGLFASVDQTTVDVDGFKYSQPVATTATDAVTDGSGDASGAPGAEEPAPEGLALIAYNVLMLPFLWTGVWGTWALGWLDTFMPVIVPWSAGAAFVAVGFAGFGVLSWRKLVSLMGVFGVLAALPVYLLAGSGATISTFQPRYILPLLVLFAMVLVTVPPGMRGVRFGRVQMLMVMGALVLAHMVALQVNIRRYVTGEGEQGFNLDAGAQWWWSDLPVGPTALWAIGTLAFAAFMASVWSELRRAAPAPVATATTPVTVTQSA